MSKKLEIRIVIPRNNSGTIDYHVEKRSIRLPLRRQDRLELLQRLSGER